MNIVRVAQVEKSMLKPGAAGCQRGSPAVQGDRSKVQGSKAPATESTRANSCRKNMLKTNQAMLKQGNTRPATVTKEKVLMRVSAFFDALKCLIITRINSAHTQKSLVKQTSKAHACFKLKIEHENLIRIKGKNPLWKPAPHQQLRRVASKCSVWW